MRISEYGKFAIAGAVLGAAAGYFMIEPSIANHREVFRGLTDIVKEHPVISKLTISAISSALTADMFYKLAE